jgi:hypothetical protein
MVGTYTIHPCYYIWTNGSPSCSYPILTFLPLFLWRGYLQNCFQSWLIFTPASKASERYARFLLLGYIYFCHRYLAPLLGYASLFSLPGSIPWPLQQEYIYPCQCWVGYIHHWSHSGIFIPGPPAGYTFIPGPAGIGPSVGIYSSHAPQLRYIHPWLYC